MADIDPQVTPKQTMNISSSAVTAVGGGISGSILLAWLWNGIIAPKHGLPPMSGEAATSLAAALCPVIAGIEWIIKYVVGFLPMPSVRDRRT